MWQSSIFILYLKNGREKCSFSLHFWCDSLDIYKAWLISVNDLTRKWVTNCLGSLFCQERQNWLLITANLFCRWHARRKTQSPWSLFRQSCGERAEAFMSWQGSGTFSIASLSKILIMNLSSLQAFSDCWAESSSPPGGTRAHYTLGTRHLVQFSFNSLPVGNILFIMEHSCCWPGLL